jgi:hypothetical protein
MTKMGNLMLGIMLVLLVGGGIGLGWFGNERYKDGMNERILNGLYLKNYNESYAKETANEMDKRGDWVCINVAYDMTPKEAYQTCVHECGHKAYTEIFAEACEKDFIKCLGWLNEK